MTAELSLQLGREAWSQNEQRVAKRLDQAESLMEFKDPYGSLNKFSELIDAGYVPVIAGNHDHHLDIAGMHGVVSRLSARPQTGWNLIVADSLLEGDQGERLARFANGMRPLLAEQNIHVRGVLREKDVAEYYGEGKKSQEELVAAKKRSRETAEAILDGVQDGTGLVVFPAGTIQESRKRPDGRRFQMGRFDSPFLPSIARRVIKAGRKLAVLTVGMDGVYKIIEPDKKLPTIRGLISIGRMEIADLVGQRTNEKPIADINIGEIITDDDLTARGIFIKDPNFPRKFNDALGFAIASNIAFKQRGYYNGQRFRS